MGGARGGRPSLILDQTEARRAEKVFWVRLPPHLFSGSGWPPRSPHLKVWTRHCTKCAVNQNSYKPRVRTNTGKQMISFMAINLWKSISRYLKDLNEYALAKKKNQTLVMRFCGHFYFKFRYCGYTKRSEFLCGFCNVRILTHPLFFSHMALTKIQCIPIVIHFCAVKP